MGFKGKDECYNKAADDEPIFVLRAKDKFAPNLVMLWIKLVETANSDFKGTDKWYEAYGCRQAMLDWQQKNGCKVPD